MIISPIELFNQSVADPEGADKSLQYPPPPPEKKPLLIWALYAPESTISSLRFLHFSGGA